MYACGSLLSALSVTFREQRPTRLAPVLLPPCTAYLAQERISPVPRHWRYCSLRTSDVCARPIEPSSRRTRGPRSSSHLVDFSATAIAHHPDVHHSCLHTIRSVFLRSVQISTQWPLSQIQRSLTSRAPSPGSRSALRSSRAGCRARLALQTSRRRASG
jgi:hypothetical protein